MIGRVVEIAETGNYLSLHRGFLVVTAGKEEKGRVPLDDIAVLLISGHGNSLSTNVVNKLVEKGAQIVFCGPNFQPSGLIWPMDSHHLQQHRIHLQIEVSQPLKKRLWQTLVRAKIGHQAEVLKQAGKPDPMLESLVKRVGSGDPENCEAQAARRYWKPLLGDDFKRDTDAGGANAFLNYGYAVLRAATARAVSAVGLHPTLSLHHRNKENPFGLVDDLMEPFRPCVDVLVRELQDKGEEELTPSNKQCLASVLHRDLQGPGGVSPLANCLLRLAQSLVASYEEKKDRLILPTRWSLSEDGE